MLKVGIVGWRGMVGSVLMERMRAENDFNDLETVFFSTSQAGQPAPDIGRDTPPVSSFLIPSIIRSSSRPWKRVAGPISAATAPFR